MVSEIIERLYDLKNHPEPDEYIFEAAAAYVWEANEIAIEHGIEPLLVGNMVNPIRAIAIVNRLFAQLPASDFVKTDEAAKLLKISPNTVGELIRTGRLEAVNVGKPGKRPQYRIHRDALCSIKPDDTLATRRQSKPPKEII